MTPRGFLRIIRIPNVLIAVLTFLIVAAKNNLPLLGALPTAFATAFGNVVNDIYDEKIDRKRKPWRPIPSGEVSIREAKITATALALAAIATSLYSACATAIVLLALASLVFYAKYGKDIKYLGNVLVAFFTALAVAFPFLQVCRWDFPLNLVTATFLAMWAREIAKDIEEGERNGVKKLAGKGQWALMFLLLLGAALTAATINAFLLILVPILLYPVLKMDATLTQKVIKLAVLLVLLVYITTPL